MDQKRASWCLGWGAALAVCAAAGGTQPADPATPPAPAAPPEAGAALATGAAPADAKPALAPDAPTLPGSLGFAGEGSYPLRQVVDRPTIASPDRWRIGWPAWDRYNRAAPSDPFLMNATGGDSPFTLGSPINPYDRSILKGDYPILGQDIFLNFSAVSDTLIGVRKNPTPSGNSAAEPGSLDQFADGEAFFVNQNFFVTLELFKGYTAYRPVDWLVRVTPVFNLNYVELQETNNLNIDPREDDTRSDTFTTLQEAFFEYHLGDVSEHFDILAVKAGRQLFVSDFRGFVFNDVSDGVRLFGNAAANRVQYNLAFFNQPEKDTNSGLNELNWRQQQVLIANAFVQDTFFLGWTTNYSFHWNHDRSDERYDTNGFPVRPDLAGDVLLRDLDAYYLGFASDGHIGRLNISHAFYYAFGEDKNNPIAGRAVDISAFLGALELSVDFDWFRPKASFLWASGDDDPTDGTAGGFDGIIDDPTFAGGASSFYQNQRLGVFGVGLNQPRSFYSTLKASKAEGVANFVNPGTVLVNAGFDAEVTPKLRTSFNANYLFFADTSSLEYFLNQPNVSQELGGELNLFAQYRPLLNNNIILTAGASVFFPGKGFRQIYDDGSPLFNLFTGITLTY